MPSPLGHRGVLRNGTPPRRGGRFSLYNDLFSAHARRQEGRPCRRWRVDTDVVSLAFHKPNLDKKWRFFFFIVLPLSPPQKRIFLIKLKQKAKKKWRFRLWLHPSFSLFSSWSIVWLFFFFAPWQSWPQGKSDELSIIVNLSGLLSSLTCYLFKYSSSSSPPPPSLLSVSDYLGLRSPPKKPGKVDTFLTLTSSPIRSQPDSPHGKFSYHFCPGWATIQPNWVQCHIYFWLPHVSTYYVTITFETYMSDAT